MSAIENKIARTLVQEMLGRGYSVSVWEGEDWAIVKSRQINKILEATNSTGEDWVHAIDDAGKSVGAVLLIWGNGEDLISDSGAAVEIDDICKAVNQKLEA